MVLDQNNRQRLMTPGPVQAPQSVLKKLAEPIIHHRTPEFTQLYTQVQKQLQVIFKTQNPVLSLTATGSGAMEASVVNFFSPNDPVAVVVGGKFGQRWLQMCETYGLQVHPIHLEWGEALSPGLVEAAFEATPQLKGFFVQACETSTGTWHNIQEVSEIINKHSDCLYIVDGITAVGVTELAMDDWHIDVLISGSQKAFMMPTGLSFISLSEAAQQAAKSSTLPRFYFDLSAELKAHQKKQTRFSSPATLFKALEEALSLMTQNPSLCVQRAHAMAHVWRQCAKHFDLQIFSQNPSPSLTALLLPETIDGQKLRQTLEDQHGVVVMGGQDHLKGKILRIGHMGDIQKEDVLFTIKSLALALEHYGHSVDQANVEKSLRYAENQLSQVQL